MPASEPRPWLPVAAVAVTLVLWASAFVAIRHLASDFSAGALSLGRLLVGAVALGAVALPRGLPRPSGRDWVGLVVIGVLWFGVYNVALNQGEHHVDAGTSVMLIQISPVLIALLATMFLGERFTLWLGIGLALAFAGVALISLAQPNGQNELVGVLLCLLAALVYSISLVVQKPLVSRLSALHVTWIACTIGALVCLPFAGRLVDDTRHASASDIGWVVYLVPPITIVMAWLFLGEVPPAMAFVGGALALVGVAVARHRPRVPEVVPEPA